MEKNMSDEKKNIFYGLNGIRTIAAIGIIFMHVYANYDFSIRTDITESLHHLVADFVFLFMIISGFSICCGYYEKIKNNSITVNQFYIKRIQRIWPFFSILVLIDLIFSRKLLFLFEGFANLTLLFGFLPNPKFQVVGVGWFLGVVFAFYVFFPFLVFAFWNKRRALISFSIFSCISWSCSIYMFDESKVGSSFDYRTNILYCMIYFAAGILIYMFKEKIIEYSYYIKKICSVLLITGVTLYVVRPPVVVNYDCIATILRVLTFSSITILGITMDNRLLNNRFTAFISSISMQLYLCHMVSFRLVEKLGFFEKIGSGWLGYIVVVICVILLAVIIQFVIEQSIKLVFRKIQIYKL